MKHRTFAIFITLLAAGLGLVAVSGYSQEDITTVHDSAFGNRMRGPVAFMHDDHNEKAGIPDDCVLCHHGGDEKGNMSLEESSEGQKCSECHELKNDDNPIPLAKYYHLQCKGCHLEKKKGPVMCGECHAK